MARHQPAISFGGIATLFTASFIVLFVVLALLGNFGLPDLVLSTIIGGTTLAMFVAIGLRAGTMQTSEFYLAGRSLPVPVNGVASAVALMSGGIFLGLAGDHFADTGSAAALTVGLALGFLLLAVGIAPYFRKSGAFGVADFLGVRYGGRVVRLAAVIVVLVALAGALATAIATAALIATILFDTSSSLGLAIVVAVILSSTVLGGMRAVTLASVVQYIVMAFAFLVPVAAVATREFSLPIPQLTFGLAMHDAAALAAESGRDLAAPLAARFLSFSAVNGLAVVATVASLAMGVAVLPHVLVRSATVPRVDEARRAVGWSLMFVLVIALTAPAYAAFVKLALLRDVAGTGLEQLPEWVFTYGKLGFVRVCGVAPASVDAILAACSQGADFTGNLAASDLAVSGDAIVLAGPAIFDLPYVFSALIATGALAATLGAANAMALALASAFGHDFYAGVVNTRASAGRELIVTRLILLGFVLGTAWVASVHARALPGLVLAAFSLPAGGLFPAVVLAIWWKRANAAGAVAGIVAGAAVTVAIIVEHRYPGVLPLGFLNPANLGLNELTAAVVGVPVGFLAAIAGSLATAPPSEDRQAIVDAIRRPGGAPFVQESES